MACKVRGVCLCSALLSHVVDAGERVVDAGEPDGAHHEAHHEDGGGEDRHDGVRERPASGRGPGAGDVTTKVTRTPYGGGGGCTVATPPSERMKLQVRLGSDLPIPSTRILG